MILPDEDDRAIVQAEGSGLWWTLYSFVNHLLKPFNLEFRFDTQPCLPEPIPPAYPIYERVGKFSSVLVSVS